MVKLAISALFLLAVSAQAQLATVHCQRKAFRSSIPINLYSGLIHAWMLNEGSGSTVPDRIGGKDLTLQGGASWTTQSGMTCVNLASGQYMDTAAWAVGANNITLVGWFYGSDGVIDRTWAYFEKQAVNVQPQLISYYSYILRGGSSTSAIGTPPSANAWHQLAGTINGTAGKLYVDGVDVTTISTVDAFTDASTTFLVGYASWSGSQGFHGKVGPLYIYDRALTATEVAQLYAAVYLY